MRASLLLILIAAFFFSCGRGSEPDHAPTLELGGFAEYVTRFEEAAAAQGLSLKVTDLRIGFGPMDSPYENGICSIVGNETPTIILKQSAWELLAEAEREALLFHEMGHCVLRRKHRPEKKRGLPTSLMYPYTIDRLTYQENLEPYLRELFSVSGEF